MSQKMAVALLLLFSFACSHKASKEDSQSRTPQAEKENLLKEAEQLGYLVEEALTWRTNAAQFAKSMVEKSKSKTPFTSADLDALYLGAEQYLHLRERIYGFITRAAFLVTDPYEIRLNPGQGTKLENNTYFVDPSDDQGFAWIVRLHMGLGASFLLYDNYLLAISPFELEGKTRRLLNSDDRKIFGQLRAVTQNYLSKANQQRVSKATMFFHQTYIWLKRTKTPIPRELQYLEILIRQSPTYNRLKYSRGGPADDNFWSVELESKDQRKQAMSNIMNSVSKVFGNTMGVVQSRHGKLFSLPQAERKQIISELQPLDVLLEKTPFRLTDKFIPGHYGHVAIWVGNEKQLEELGILNDPLVQKYLPAIRKNHFIVEALRPGVELNTLDHFLDIDDILVLRHKSLTLEEKRNFILKTLGYIGREYDFNFDVESDDKIVCSELAYRVFANVKFPTEQKAGRFTISPDHVAILGTGNGPFEPVMIYYDGRRLTNNLNQNLQYLLEEKYDQVR